jgi:hypothetical protein
MMLFRLAFKQIQLSEGSTCHNGHMEEPPQPQCNFASEEYVMEKVMDISD